jgi:hypothetical protein
MTLPNPDVHENGAVSPSPSGYEIRSSDVQWAALASWPLALEPGEGVIIRARGGTGRISASLFTQAFDGLFSNEEPWR